MLKKQIRIDWHCNLYFLRPLLFIVLVFGLMLGQVEGQITSFTLSVSPKTVNTASTASFTLKAGGDFFDSGTYVITLPITEVAFDTGFDDCTTVTSGITIDVCAVQSGQITYTITADSPVATLQLRTTNFINPISTTDVSGIDVVYTDGLGDDYAGTATLSDLEPMEMSVGASISPTSDIIAASTTVTITFTTENMLPVDGIIQMVFPNYFSATSDFLSGQSQSCTGLTNIDADPDCSFSPSSNTLELSNFLSGALAGGSEVSFTVADMKNPYNEISRSGFTIYTLDSNYGYIDYTTDMSYQVSTFGTFLLSYVSRPGGGTTVVNEPSTLEFFVELDYPIDANCRLRIYFPSDMPVTTSISTADGTNYFSSTSGYEDRETGLNYVDVDGCSSSASSGIGLVTLYSPTNKGYVQTTETFLFQLYAMQGAAMYKIAESDVDMTLSDFTEGEITTLTVTPVSTSDVQSQTTYTITLLPEHDIPQSSQITIEFPSSFNLADGACSISSTVVVSTSATCTVSSNVVTLEEPFGGSSSYEVSDGTMSFILSTPGTNPDSENPDIGSFTASTYAVDGSPYPIDTGDFTSLFTAVSTSTVGSVAAGSTTACDSGVTYTFEMTTAKTIPSGGKIEIAFPPGVYLTQAELTSCKVTYSGGTEVILATSSCVVDSSSDVIVTIDGAFGSDYSDASFEVELTGITNPSSTTATGSFSITSMDSSDYLIEYVDSGLSVEMVSLSPITVFSATLNSDVNGAVSTMEIEIEVNCPLTTGDELWFTVPAEIAVADSASCSEVKPTALTGVACTASSNQVVASITVSSTLPTGTVMAFTIDAVTNPPSTCATSTFFDIGVYDSTGDQINEYAGGDVTVATDTAATATAVLVQDSQEVSASTTYTIEYTCENLVPSGSSFIVGYPTEITMPGTFTDCYINVDGNNYDYDCADNGNQIVMSGNTGLTTDIAAGKQIDVVLSMVTNPDSQLDDPPSLTIYSYADDTQTCKIDKVETGLEVGFTCNYPCFTCNSADKDLCLSCNPADVNGNIYLLGGTCVTECGDGSYPDGDNECQDCMDQCLTCTDGTTCDSCDTSGTYDILYLDDCIAVCPTGTYQPSSTFSCEDCDSTCKECSSTADSCDACYTTSSKPYLYSSTCISSCPDGYVDVNYECEACTSPCLTCENSKSYCLTCESSYYLYENDCVNPCPSGTVATTDTDPISCLDCGTNCKTCQSADTDICYSCDSNYFLYEQTCIDSCPTGTYERGSTRCGDCDSTCQTCDGAANDDCLTCDTTGDYPNFLDGSCLETCPEGYYSINNKCRACTSPCLTCEISSSTCTSCINNYYLFESTCYQRCPTGTVKQSDLTIPICASCGNFCEKCSASDPNICTRCEEGYYSYEGDCFEVCPDGTYLPSDSTTCQVCDDNCGTCSLAPSNCTSCDGASEFPLRLNNTCKTSCPDGYVQLELSCEACTAPCLTCAISQNTCNSCVSQHLLYFSECYDECPEGTTASDDVCIGCTTSCLTCNTDASQCLECSDGFFLHEDQCYITCPGDTVANNATKVCVPLDVSGNDTDNPTVDISDDQIYLYFPVTIAQSVLGAISVGSHIKDPGSLAFSNTLALWGPLEFLAYGGQAYLAYVQEVEGMTQKEFILGEESTTDTPDTTETSQNTSNSSNVSTNASANATSRRILRSQPIVLPLRQLQTTEETNWPLVFYGTGVAFGFLIITNIVWAIVHCVLVGRDDGYRDHSKRHCFSSKIIGCCSGCCNYKVGRFHFSRFFGMEMFSTNFGMNKKKIQTVLNVLTIFNLVATLLPIVFVDIYGIATNQWGNQFYLIMIETLFLALCVIIVGVLEFKYSSMTKHKEYAPVQDISMDSYALMQKIEDEIKSRFGGLGIDDFLEQLKIGKGLNDDGEPLKGKGRSRSMDNLHRELEYGERRELDERRVNTEPLDPETLKYYQNQPNPFIRNEQDPEHPNNCYAEPGKLPKRVVLEDRKRIKIIQTGENVMDAEEYERDFQQRHGKKEDTRKDDRMYGKQVEDDDEDDFIRKKKKKDKMRGRKDKYYQQVDHEDENFAVDAHGNLLDDDEDDDDDMMEKIDEESQYEDDEEKIKAQMEQERKEKQALEEQKQKEDEEVQEMERKKKDEEQKAVLEAKRLKDEEELKGRQAEEERQKKEEEEKKKQEDERKKKEEDEKKQREAEEQKKKEEEEKKQKEIEDLKKQQEEDNKKLSAAEKKKKEEEEKKAKEEADKKAKEEAEKKKKEEAEQKKKDEAEKKAKDEAEKKAKDEAEKKKEEEKKALEQKQAKEMAEQQKKAEEEKKAQEEKQLQLQKEKEKQEELKRQEEEAEKKRKQAEEEELVKNNDEMLNFEEEEAGAGDGQGAPPMPEEKNKEELKKMEEKILEDEKKKKEEVKEHEKPVEEMGAYDSDEDNDNRLRNMRNPELRKFNVNDILGDLERDEKGNLVILPNKQGQLVDLQGNAVNEKGYLIDKKTGDVVEKENKAKIFDKKELDERGELPPPFNIERFNFNPHDIRGHFDRDQHGDPIIGNHKNKNGEMIDKLGRRVNEHGFLVDGQGNVVDKRGRIRMHHKLLDKDGNMPMMFTYRGQKFDVRDVIGDLEKDRKGNIIIRRDKDNNMVDKKGRRVNSKGYLVDLEGNVVDSDGTVRFDQGMLSRDNEIPKFFPFLKFNVEDIRGEFEMDPGGNPILQKNSKGEFLDNKGRKVNEKGYLVDERGNVENKRGYKVFGRLLMDQEGEIPEVFRAKLFRKDTVDSFNQLMNEIEDLEKMHEQDEGHEGKRKQKRQLDEDENERIARKIEQIVEEDNDDDDMIMKELEELARDGERDEMSEGGNTSVDSKMEDTPSNYNIANQRFMEQEQMRERVMESIRKGEAIPDDEDNESEYMLPGKKIKRRKKKPKKKQKKVVKQEPQIDVRDLMMAQAYGGLSSNQVDRLIQDRKRKEMAAGSQMVVGKPPMQKNASNSRLGSMQNKRVHLNKNFEEGDNKSEWTANVNLEGENAQRLLGTKASQFGLTENQVPASNRNRNENKSQVKRSGVGMGLDIKKNNLMNSTANSFKQQNDGHSSNQSMMQNNLSQNPDLQGNPNRDRKLSNIANSVSGFYREQTLSEQSKLRSTHESNFAANVPANNLSKKVTLQEAEEMKHEEEKKEGGENFDQDLDRIYGAARGFGDMSMMSDWEKDSALSDQSGFSQMNNVTNQKKIRGLEKVYLQRLEPASKLKKKKSRVPGMEPKFRNMHHRMHDEPQWHLNQDEEDRDDLDSVLSENYRQMERKFKEAMGGESESRKKKNGLIDDENKPNIFAGNLYQYKAQQEKKKLKEDKQLDFNK